MAETNPYIEHSVLEDTTFGELLLGLFRFKSISDLVSTSGFTITQLMEYNPFGQITNKDMIRMYYTDEELVDYDTLLTANSEDALVKSGTTLVFPGSLDQYAFKVVHRKVISQTVLNKYKDYDAFLGEEIDNLIKDEKYAPKEKIFSKFKKDLYKVTAQNVEITVLVWSRALNRVINISPFIINMDTTVGGSGGNFNISLPPLTIPEDQSLETGPLEFAWENLYRSISIFKKDGKYNYSFKDTSTFVGELSPMFGHSSLNNFNPIDYEAISNPKRILDKNLLFNILLSHQDMIFIKFERLLFDDDNLKELRQFELLNLSDTKGHVWDMVGLIDNVAVTRNEMNNDYVVNVGGRDLMKLLIQDGVYIYPLADGNFQEQFVANSSEIANDPSYGRLFGELQDLTLHLSQPISVVLEFILKQFGKIEVIPDDELRHLNKEYNPLDLVGAWKFTRLVVDDSVADKFIVDSGLASNMGSLINFVKRVCQEPFVEFFGDTYGDKYYFIVRKPITTKQSILSNYTVAIKREDIINFSAGFTDSNTYSWYRLNPRGAYFGDQELAQFFLPAVYFPEYAKIWGANPLEISSNYLYYGVGEDKEILDLGYQQAIEDLKYIIQSNAYNPFVRSGKLTVNPDRRIKYGMNVYVDSTDEIYRVNGVTQSYSISDSQVDRVTSLSVLNGMVLTHIDKYFNVINMPSPTGNDLESRKLRWKVNSDVFDFLMRKKQFFKNLNFPTNYDPTASNVEAVKKMFKQRPV